jgi:hypothetical protein
LERELIYSSLRCEVDEEIWVRRVGGDAARSCSPAQLRSPKEDEAITDRCRELAAVFARISSQKAPYTRVNINLI